MSNVQSLERALTLLNKLSEYPEGIQISQPYLEKLCKEINETVHLCIEDHGEVIYIDKIESNQTISAFIVEFPGVIFNKMNEIRIFVKSEKPPASYLSRNLGGF
ncbi:IclR family transcriptional regulator domain-containing protein [Fictibacillus enclensis]|uniref:IclR family transcriptional regulator domain-containing protein n=1 Tax=Fictibacillus enclensis TaxID=1017270 RepID=UPI0024C0A57C|nr:hypothetical protein [Fictibacillus enclensis]WHY70637.1 hypothetical protein QNH15_16490 [Fictibacillus enclensis]